MSVIPPLKTYTTLYTVLQTVKHVQLSHTHFYRINELPSCLVEGVTDDYVNEPRLLCLRAEPIESNEDVKPPIGYQSIQTNSRCCRATACRISVEALLSAGEQGGGHTDTGAAAAAAAAAGAGVSTPPAI